MQKYIIILAIIAVSCNRHTKQHEPGQQQISKRVKTSEFELVKATHQRGLLILFPCFPCDAQNTLNEFKIARICVKKGFSVLAMNLNEHLYLKPAEKQGLAKLVTKIIHEQNLSEKNIFMGGFSSGGNVALVFCNYLKKSKSKLQPKGIFVVDSPVDLLGLYKTAEKNLKLDFSESAVQESKWIKNLFDKEFGKPSEGIANYEENSPYTFKTQNIDNLKDLENVKIRFYTEPDLNWWKEYNKNEYEDLNAFYFQKLSDRLKTEFDNNNIELIKTEKRGYRANGQRHPHSWSIVDEENLVNWMSE